MTQVLAIINGLVVLAFCLARSKQRPFIVLDLTWALVAGFFINYSLRPILIGLLPETFAVYRSYGTGGEEASAATEHALLLALGFILAFVVADLTGGQARHQMHGPIRQKYGTVVMSSHFTLVAVLLVCLGPLGMAGYLSATGWSGTLQSLMSGAARFYVLGKHAGLGYYMLALYLCEMGWLALCLRWELTRSTQRLSAATLAARALPLLVCVAVFTVFGERQGIVIAILTPLLVSLMRLKARCTLPRLRTPWLRIITVGAVAAVIAGPIGMVLKQQHESRPSEVVALAISPWDSYELTLAAVDRVNTQDVLFGMSYVEDVFYTYIPRLWFPDKPFRYGIYSIQDRVFPELQQMTGSFPPGILVEAYVNAGAAYLVVPITLAWAFKVLYRRLREQNLFWVAQAAILFPVLLTFRSLGSVMSQLVLNTGLLIVLAVMIRLFNLREPRASGPRLEKHRALLSVRGAAAWRMSAVDTIGTPKNQ